MLTTVFVAAIAVLVAFGFLVIYMLGHTDASDVTWNRQVYVYGSVEAIVFAAAGALFGVQVKRAETARAQTQADQANQEAQEAQEAKQSERLAAKDAEKGRTIAATARGLAAASPAPSATEDLPNARGAAPAGLTSRAALRAMANVADELFPRST